MSEFFYPKSKYLRSDNDRCQILGTFQNTSKSKELDKKIQTFFYPFLKMM